jgi:hypothetical protein
MMEMRKGIIRKTVDLARNFGKRETPRQLASWSQAATNYHVPKSLRHLLQTKSMPKVLKENHKISIFDVNLNRGKITSHHLKSVTNFSKLLAWIVMLQ